MDDQSCSDLSEPQKQKKIKFNDVIEVKRDERRKKNRPHPRRRRSGGNSRPEQQNGGNKWSNRMESVATAPTNTTQFIINDHNSPLPRGINGSPISACPTPNSDGGSRSRDGHEYDQLGDYYPSSRINDSAIEQFAQEYSQFQYERLSEMSREDLIKKCIELEEALDCYDRVNHQYDGGSSSESEFNSRPYSRHCSTCSCVFDNNTRFQDSSIDESSNDSNQNKDEFGDESVVDTTTHCTSPPKVSSFSSPNSANEFSPREDNTVLN